MNPLVDMAVLMELPIWADLKTSMENGDDKPIVSTLQSQALVGVREVESGDLDASAGGVRSSRYSGAAVDLSSRKLTPSSCWPSPFFTYGHSRSRLAPEGL